MNRRTVAALLATLVLAAADAAGQTNLLANPGFESGATGWGGLAAGDISTASPHSGSRCVRLTAGSREFTQGPFTAASGRTYTLVGWVRKDKFAGGNWGYFRMVIRDDSLQDESVNSRNLTFPAGQWVKKAVSFTALRGGIRVSFGVFGPQDSVDLLFDDFALFEKSANLPPVLAPQASAATVAAGASVAFTANADDPDGAVAVYRWEFGDGAEAITENPTHAWYRPGTFAVVLTVWDNDGALARDTISVTVTAAAAPGVTITSPADAAAYATSSAQVTLAGTAAASSGRQITRVVWDNLSTRAADTAALTPGVSVNWSAGAVALKPGRNEILVSAFDSQGEVNTDVIVVTRQTSAPAFSNVQALSSSVPLYGKYEVTFDLATVADHPMFAYDPAPAAGQAPGTGVTVEGVFRTPSGATLRQPAFWYQRSQPDATAASGEPTHFAEPEAQGHWAVRFSPQEPGAYQVSLEARDASGSASASVGTFTATLPSATHGFIRVSPDDPRYFEYSDRTFHFPIGPASDWTGSTGAGGALNYARPWMGGTGAYSTNWSRWKSTAEQWGNEGGMTPLAYTQHYPSHELSYRLFWPEGRRIWITSWCDDRFYHRLKVNTNYLVKVRLKTVGLAGPANASYPWGFMIKTHGWPGDSVERDIRAQASITPVVSVNRDWHTVVARYRHTSSSQNDISLFLDNVTAGEVYVDEFSMREIAGDGTLGGELIRNAQADQHTYVEQRPAAWFDWQVANGQQTGVAFQYVVQDKNDWIPNHLNSAGVFHENGAGYYAADNTRVRWLQRQWWRYCAARWGYSTAVRAWELCNEGPPADPGSPHALTAQSFARYMHTIDAHPHLASTSFWAGWRPAFWGDNVNYGDVSYADRHAYTEGDTLGYDLASWYEFLANGMYPDAVDKPIIIAETGVSTNFGPITELAQANDGTWYHNLLWAQLSHTGVSCPNYWFSEHFQVIQKDTIAARFARFVRGLDLNRGGYVPLGATVSNPQLRVAGQKNPARGTAYLWVHNRTHTWARVMGVGGRGSVIPQSGTITLTLSPSTDYPVQWYNTWTGAIDSMRTVRTNGSGQLTIQVANLQSDFAVAVNRDIQSPVRPGAGRPPAGRLAIEPLSRALHGVALRLTVPERCRARLQVLDPAGRLVATLVSGEVGPGTHVVVWDSRGRSGGALGGGLYVCRLEAMGRVLTAPVVMMR